MPKFDELREIVKISDPRVIGITETKLDNLIGDSEIYIDRYFVIRHDRNRKGGGAICYITNKICYYTKIVFQMKKKISSSHFLFQKQNQLLLGLFINLQIKQGF